MRDGSPQGLFSVPVPGHRGIRIEPVRGHMPTRRRVLGAVAAAALAGCASPDFDYSGGGSADERATSRASGDGTERSGGSPVPGDGETATATGTAATSPRNGTDDGGSSATALSTPAFEDGGTIPERFTADGANVSPPLSVPALPDATTVYALLVEDLDVDDAPFTHWLVWNVSPGIESVPAGIPPEERVDALGGARQGTNDFGTIGYRGPDPPASDPPHSYRFAVLALSEGLSLPAGADRSAFDEAVEDVVVGRADLTATYVR